MEIPYTIKARPDTGLINAKLGIWLFLASEVMLFGALFSSYILLRVGAVEWPHHVLDVPLATVNTAVLITSSITMVMSWASLMMKDFRKYKLYMGATILLGFIFLTIKYFEYSHHIEVGEIPSKSTFFAIYFTMTGLHMLHVIGGMIVNSYFWGPGSKMWKTESRAIHEPGRGCRALLAFCRPGVDIFISRPLLIVGEHMELSHAEDIKKHIKVYISVFATLLALTIITVTISYFNLSVVPAIIVALIIASVKGSLVASYFMHLISEKKMIYAALSLTVVFFLVLIFIPLLAMSDRIH